MKFCKLAVYSILALYISVLYRAEYSGKGIPLGNAGINSKPLLISTLEDFVDKLRDIQEETGDLDRFKISKAFKEYKTDNIQSLKNSYITDIKYNLCKEKKLIDCNEFKHQGEYYKISEEELEYYLNAIHESKLMSAKHPDLDNVLTNAMNKNIYSNEQVKAHFTKHAKQYIRQVSTSPYQNNEKSNRN